MACALLRLLFYSTNAKMPCENCSRAHLPSYGRSTTSNREDQVMADTDELNHEEVDEQSRRILQDLRRMYPATAEVARPLARVEQRLFHASDAPPRARSSTVNLKRAPATTFNKRMWQRRF